MNPFHSDVDYSRASDILSTLEDCKTPLQMLYVLDDTVDCIAESVQQYMEQKKLPLEALTTDDLIPIVAYVMVLADFQHFPSALSVMESFVFTDISSTKIRVHLDQFQRSLSYTNGTDETQSSSNENNSEIPITNSPT